jgi:rhodanese-related sulfurtransferase
MKIFTYLSFFLCIYLITNELSFGQSKVPPAEFSKLMQQKKRKTIVLDVRTPEEFAEGHLERALNINFYDENFKQQLAQLDKKKKILIYCRSGNRSGKAMAMLQELGFQKVIDLAGGITQWKTEGKKVLN